MSVKMSVLNWVLRTFERPALSKITEPAVARARVEGQARLFADVPRVAYDRTVLATDGFEVPAGVVNPPVAHPRAAVLFLHGGAYTLGGFETHKKLCARIAAGTRLTGFVPEYRLAPEHPFPAAFDDAVASYTALVERGYNRIVIAGDSAGGGLSFALLHHICASDLPDPVAVVALSPWTDLTNASPSLTDNDASEVMLPVERIPELASEYLGTAPADDPRASPVYGSFTGAPDILIQVSQKEALFDDALRMADKLRADGVEVTVQTWDNTYHVWQLMHDRIPEATEAVEGIIAFINTRLG